MFSSELLDFCDTVMPLTYLLQHFLVFISPSCDKLKDALFYGENYVDNF